MINYHYRDVSSLAKENIEKAREVVKKNIEGATELVKGNYASRKKLENLSDKDKEIATSLYLLQYRDGSLEDRKGITNKEWLEKTFDKSYSEIVGENEELYRLIRDRIIYPRRKETWDTSPRNKDAFKKEAKEKREELTKEELEKAEEERQKANDAMKEKIKDKPVVEPKKEEPVQKPVEEPVKEEPPAEKPEEAEPEEKDDDEFKMPSSGRSDTEDRYFDEALRELEDYKEQTQLALNNLLKANPEFDKVISNQLERIDYDYNKRISKMKKAKEGLTANPRLRLNQELALGKSFMNRAIYTARKEIAPNALQRVATAGKDILKRTGEELGGAAKAASKLYPFRKASQMKQDARAKLIAAELDNKQMEKYVYSDDKEEKEAIYQEALKAKSARQAKEAKEKAAARAEAAEDKRREKSSADLRRMKELQPKIEAEEAARAAKEKEKEEKRAARSASGRARILANSTDVSELPSLYEDMKQKLKNNIK